MGYQVYKRAEVIEVDETNERVGKSIIKVCKRALEVKVLLDCSQSPIFP